MISLSLISFQKPRIFPVNLILNGQQCNLLKIGIFVLMLFCRLKKTCLHYVENINFLNWLDNLLIDAIEVAGELCR